METYVCVCGGVTREQVICSTQCYLGRKSTASTGIHDVQIIVQHFSRVSLHFFPLMMWKFLHLCCVWMKEILIHTPTNLKNQEQCWVWRWKWTFELRDHIYGHVILLISVSSCWLLLLVYRSLVQCIETVKWLHTADLFTLDLLLKLFEWICANWCRRRKTKKETRYIFNFFIITINVICTVLL